MLFEYANPALNMQWRSFCWSVTGL